MELLLLEWPTSQMEWSRPDFVNKVDNEEQAEESVLSTQDDELSVVDGRLPLLLLLLAPLLAM